MSTSDINFIRQQFPALTNGFAFFDNAGGSQVPVQVANKISHYLLHANVQLGASYRISKQSEAMVATASGLWAQAINAADPAEIVMGSSSTALLQNLARSLAHYFKPGDEVIVTNCDHEANIGPWLGLEEAGIVIKTWKINPDSFQLELEELGKLMTSKTRLVAFTHVSNILGSINPVEEITRFIHERGALVCVDGVAFAPHRQVDVKKWDIDFYVFSFYKVFGPHYALLYGRHALLSQLPGINHYFIAREDVPYKLQPGNVNFELTVGSTGIIDYLDTVFAQHFELSTWDLFSRLKQVFDLFTEHEEQLTRRFLEFLASKKNIRLIGSAEFSREVRVPTFSFVVENIKSSVIPPQVDGHDIGIRWGDFFARRLINDLGLSDVDGVVRVSMVHYNTAEEVDRLIRVLDRIL
jgi:cysteine desulfurase family protein (TIGR01976 family)